MKNTQTLIFMFCFAVFFGCSNENSAQNGSPVSPVPQDEDFYAAVPSAEAGEKIFEAECMVCHGPRGQKSMPGMQKNAANLADERVQSMRDEELKKIIREGKKESPEMAGHPWLMEDEVESLILYIRSLKK
ncbi:MAG: hypothetical protein A2934_00895 [Candidatus Sungbacteria bacterium RIFCSPLOWO2_01_FULL_47_10]|uniref:Cytochrome c domain-containing protein n=1 Tax=Candidatus Sungbacteria bacterium RIFCSPLOWO2_01_FULL_47_10 TaxID=1802276 RepID=A0A1G2KZH5_9BACT|nr:MAG: hypothetical protein A2934_00895 [Candidatus Sungbacteria bacterium RIFCSPLOWO2_01_FULL_47_10]